MTTTLRRTLFGLLTIGLAILPGWWELHAASDNPAPFTAPDLVLSSTESNRPLGLGQLNTNNTGDLATRQIGTRATTNESSSTSSENWNLLAIYFGLIAFFGGLMTPLNYSLAVELVDELQPDGAKVDDQDQNDAIRFRRSIEWFVWASDFVVFVTALFGVAALFVGICISSCPTQVMCDAEAQNYTKVIIWIFRYTVLLIWVLVSIVRYIDHRRRWKKEPPKQSKPCRHSDGFGRWRHLIQFCLLTGVISWGLWLWLGQLDIIGAAGPKSTWTDRVMIHAIEVMGGLYLTWLLLTIIYRPLTHLYEIKRRKQT